LHAGGERFESAILHHSFLLLLLALEPYQYVSTTKTAHPMHEPVTQSLLSLSEYGKKIGKDRSTVSRMLKNDEKREKLGAFQCVENGITVWKIPYVDNKQGLQDVSGQWVELMEQYVKEQSYGGITGVCYSEATIERQNMYGLSLIWRFSGLEPSIENFNIDTIRYAISSVPHDPIAKIDHFSMKEKMHRAATLFAKYLIKKSLAKEDLLDEIRKIIIKRTYDTDVTYLELSEFTDILRQIVMKQSDQLLKHSYIVMVSILFFTGIRLNELANLLMDDVSLQNGTLTVRNGKGGKTRVLGIPRNLKSALETYFELRSNNPNPYLLLNIKGKRLLKYGIDTRIDTLSKQLNKKFSAHTFRRGFGYWMLSRGVDLVTIQHAYGHRDIETTIKYLGLARRKAVETMKSL
jgi:site-specific recombinase XerD